MANRLIARTLAAAWFAAVLLLPASATAMPMLAAIPFATLLASSLIGAAISFGLSFVAKALMTPQTPKAASFDLSINASNSKVSLRQPIAPRQIIYGKTRVGGIFGFMNLTGENQYLSFTLMMAGHLCQSISDPQIGDTQVTLDEFGLVIDTKYAGSAAFNKHLGAANQTVDFMLNADQPDKWTTAHRLQGIAY